MLSPHLPDLEEVKAHYKISYDQFSLLVYHPVQPPKVENIDQKANEVVEAVLSSGRNFIGIYPNNDAGSEEIFKAYQRFEGNSCVQLFPSLKFEAFLTLLRHCDFIIGNSSTGVREAPVYGKASINVGDRQWQRHSSSTILNVGEQKEETVAMNRAICLNDQAKPAMFLEKEKSAVKFMDVLKQIQVYRKPLFQRIF